MVTYKILDNIKFFNIDLLYSSIKIKLFQVNYIEY
jgi:hypothetical protein